MIVEEAPGIFSAPHSTAAGKNVIVLGEQAALAIDVGAYPEEGRLMADFIRERGYDPNRVIITHGHRDHILGGEAFRGSDVYAPRKTVAEIQRQIPSFRRQLGLDEAAISARILHPTITFDSQLWIDLGARQLHLFPTPGHSPDIVSIYLSDCRLLVASDTVVTGIVPAIFHSSLELEASINQLKQLDIETLIAGHGPVLRGQAVIQEWLNWLTAYIGDIRSAVASMIAAGERKRDAIVESIRYDEHIGERLPKDRHGMPKRHRNAVAKIADEEMAATCYDWAQ
ncbi:MAG: MBL fold metallo-hydrolase [Chloroflexi bacterium]|nr:MBL fold metallo-hydrolase [Chloroflexota bacterium]